MFTARKVVYKKGSHQITIFDEMLEQGEVSILENPTKVDGIGGVLWDGTLAACHLIGRMDLSHMRILELGCGAGLFGIYATARHHGSLVMTDREVDLAEENVSVSFDSSNSRCRCVKLDWGDDLPCEVASSSFDIIVGCEITCLYKQQTKLVETVRAISNSHTIIVMTFDGPSSPQSSAYEKSFNEHMRKAGYLWMSPGHYLVEWYKERTSHSDEPGIASPPRLFTCTITDLRRHATASTLQIEGRQAEESSEHHVTFYYRPSSSRTCSCCHSQYLPFLNASSLDDCVYHTGYYVCRRHPGETRLSINGFGDSLGYYGNGEEGWAAKFWDCCGSEDPCAIGCARGPHVPYS